MEHYAREGHGTLCKKSPWNIIRMEQQIETEGTKKINFLPELVSVGGAG